MANEIAVSIIGAGHCGCAIAADVLGRGGKVLLYAHPDHSATLHAILRQGYLDVTGRMRGRFMPVLSNDLSEALRFSDCLVLALPSFAHDDMIAALSAHDLGRHVIVCIAGNFFCLATRRSLRARAILETSSAPYASRVVGADVKVMGIKSQLHIASLAPIGDQGSAAGAGASVPHAAAVVPQCAGGRAVLHQRRAAPRACAAQHRVDRVHRRRLPLLPPGHERIGGPGHAGDRSGTHAHRQSVRLSPCAPRWR